MTKIKISQIISNINDFINSYKEKKFKINYRQNSLSDHFDQINSLVVETFDSFFILVSIYYYNLKSVNDKLDNNIVEKLNS